MTEKARARTPEEKEKRGRDILNVARSLFEKHPYKDISMAQIARTAGVAKGTVFIYYSTREELFLALAREYFGEFFEDMENRITELALQGTPSSEDLTAVLKESFSGKESFLKIIPLLGTIIEHNSGYESIREFKLFLAEKMEKTGCYVEGIFPGLGGGKGLQLFLWLYGIMIGFQELAVPSPVCSDVIENENLDIFRFDFAEQFFLILDAILRGIIQR